MKRTDLRVVIIDDNRDAAQTLSALLAVNDFCVSGTICRSVDALCCILRERPHVAILDIAMPELDGYELAAEIRTGVDWPIKLVAVTGLGSACDKADAAAAGFNAHFTKPVAWRALESLLSSYLEEFDALPPVRRR
jgi:CheY-like chemotaxis protein